MDADVIVIGAGAAGLACAGELRKNGKNVVVLEARDRIGGRVHTIRDEYGAVEVGAELVHGENAATWRIIQEEHLRTLEWEFNSDASYRVFAKDGGIRSDSETLLEKMRQTEEGLYEYNGPEISVEEYLTHRAPDSEALFFSKRHIGDYEGADTDELSAPLVAEESSHATNGSRNFWLLDGYDKVIGALARGLDIRRNCIVMNVEWGDKKVSVQHSQGIIEAALLVFTVPIGVLRSGAITFAPELPATFSRAIQDIGYGNSTKIALWIDEPMEYRRLIATEGVVSNFWMRPGNRGTLLTGFSGGSRADRLAQMPEEEALELAKADVVSAFGASFRKRIIRARRFAWLDDPYTLGSYSYSAIGQGSAREVLREPIANTLFYSGEATNSHGHIATVHGAIEAGRDTAATILAT